MLREGGRFAIRMLYIHLASYIRGHTTRRKRVGKYLLCGHFSRRGIGYRRGKQMGKSQVHSTLHRLLA